MVIVVINHDDLQQVAKGVSFIKMLRAEYEAVRLDLISTREGNGLTPWSVIMAF